MKSNRLLLVALGLSPFLGVGGCATQTVASVPPPPPPKVTVVEPVVRPLVEWDRFPGRVEPVEAVEIRSRVSGYLHSHHFEEGALVEEGTLLFKIDPRPFQADLDRAEAAVAEARARAERAKALRTQAEALRRQAESELSLATSRLRRAEQAARSNSIAGEEVDVRRSEAEKARAALAAAKASEASALAEISLASANQATAAANRERVALELSYTELRAPISGRISRRLVTEGNLIEGGTQGTLLTTLVSLDPIHVYFDATEADFLKYDQLARAKAPTSGRWGQAPAYLALAGEDGYPRKGTLDFLENRLDPRTSTIRGRAIFKNPDHSLVPGLFGTLRIPGSPAHQALQIPDSAIGSDQVQRFVMVVDEKGVARSKAVELGPVVDGLRVIRSGLTGSERVIVRGLQRVRPGSLVTPVLEALDLEEDGDGLPDVYPGTTDDAQAQSLEASTESKDREAGA